MANQRTKAQRRFADVLRLLVAIILLPLLLPILIVALTFHLLAGAFLYPAVWICWCLRGRNVLFVYSNSPIWHDYIEEHILPRLGERAVLLNWSERSRWRRTLAVLAFRYFGGYREYNPTAVVFRPFRFARKFRFYEPFREFKHGKPDAVSKMQREMFDSLDAISA